MKRLVVIESAVVAILALICGSIFGRVISTRVAESQVAQDSIANIVLDVFLILSQIIVLVVNYRTEWTIKTGFVAGEKTRGVFVLFSFLAAGTLVMAAYGILCATGRIQYVENGFQRFEVWPVLSFVAIMFVRMLLVGISEEFMFRGVMAKHLEANYGVKISVIVSTLIFTVFHCVVIECWTQVTDIFVLGLVLAIIYFGTKNIVYPIMVHCGIDFFTNLVGLKGQNSVALFYIDSANEELQIMSDLFGVMSILGVIVLVVFALVRRKRGNI